ncbi:hypothetical protein B0H13DRAFT_2277428 [Mycena leptocephala]|nr:hypothetical protein B0H13DRAFT_2277428 [Mycena leptocephala]
MSFNHVRLSALIRDATFGVSIPGLALSVFLLIIIVYLRWNPCSRPYLNRVSFRLLTYALVANAVYGSITFSHAMKAGAEDGTHDLRVLVLVFGVNGNKMEKYYITGWYAETGTCWLRDPSPSIQLRWLLGTQVVWMLLMSTVEVICFVIIVIFMMRHQARIRRLRVDALPHSASGLASHLTTFKSSLPAHPIVRYRPMILRIDLMIYALRPLLYTLLAGTDPSFLRAIRSLFPNSSSSSSPSPSQLALPTLNMTAISSLCTTDPPPSDNYNQPTTTEEEAERDNVVLQI